MNFKKYFEKKSSNLNEYFEASQAQRLLNRIRPKNFRDVLKGDIVIGLEGAIGLVFDTLSTEIDQDYEDEQGDPVTETVNTIQVSLWNENSKLTGEKIIINEETVLIVSAVDLKKCQKKTKEAIQTFDDEDLEEEY